MNITIHPLSFSNNQELSHHFDKLNIAGLTSSIFNSKMWYQGWLNATNEPLHAAEFRRNESAVIGLAVFSLRQIHPYLPTVKRASLNQAAVEKSDQCWIEYNQIYCPIAYQKTCSRLLIEYVFNQLNATEFYISMTADYTLWQDLADAARLNMESECIPGYQTDLGNVTGIDNLLRLFSSNTRSQIRRAIKKVESIYGPLTTISAPDNEKWPGLIALGELHRQQWSTSGEGSGFDNPVFLAHHEFMVHHCPRNIAIITVYAGDHFLGSGYFFLSKDTVFFYCSGLPANIEHKHIKPGYLFHIMAMLYFAREGFNCYDFLGGDYQYKQSLSTASNRFHHITLYNNSKRSGVLQTLKAFKRRVTHRR